MSKHQRPPGGRYQGGNGSKPKGGYGFYFGGKRSTAPGWCYLCGESHLYEYPCALLERYQRAPKRIKDRARYVERAKVAGKTPSPRADDSIPSGGLEQGAPATP